MGYNLGVIGLGHWFSWLKAGIGEGESLNLVKAVGTKPFEQKMELLSSFGITSGNYFISDQKGLVPDRFFEGIDIVHISDPNKFHFDQTMQSLSKGKYVVTEKTLAVNKSQFGKISSFIRKNNYQDHVYLHLHYLHKQTTIVFKDMLKKLIRQNGRIKSIAATFFEEVNGEDPKRTWVLNRDNGGIAMDWIHPYEIMYYSTKCRFGSMRDLNIFMVNGSYDQKNPTGIEAVVELLGRNFTDEATATVRVAKGVGNGHGKKSLTVVFESGNSAKLLFPGHEAEFENKEQRGLIEIFDNNGNVVSSDKLTGQNSSEIFIKEVLDLCNGRNDGLKLSEISRIFKPQWDYQRIVKSKELVRDPLRIEQFLKDGAAA